MVITYILLRLKCTGILLQSSFSKRPQHLAKLDYVPIQILRLDGIQDNEYSLNDRDKKSPSDRVHDKLL